MKKIFILTGEPSGDKLASKVISKLQKNNPNIEYSCVGGTHLNSLGIKSIFDLKEITYIGFTSVFLNILKIKNKINNTVEEIREITSAKSLKFLSINGLYKAMGYEKRNNTYPQLTDHYFTGDYPVEITDELGDNKVTQLSLLSTGSNN